MENKDIEELTRIKDSLSKKTSSQDVVIARISDPIDETARTLHSYYQTRLNKLKEDSNFEEFIKGKIIDRIDEASLSQLVTLLEIVQKNSNIAMEKALMPLMGPQGVTQTTPLQDTVVTRKDALEIEDKDIQQGLLALSQIMSIVKEKETRVIEPPKDKD